MDTVVQKFISSTRLNLFYGTVVSKALRRKSVANTLCTSFNADEVIPAVYIGNVVDAHNVDELKKRGITHVVDAVLGVAPPFPEDFKYLHVPLIDCPSESILPHFNQTCAFIEEAIASGGKVLVHCMRGVSRSATLVAAYLMYERRVTCKESVAILQDKRSIICPNDGFMMQLQWYEKILITQRNIDDAKKEEPIPSDSVNKNNEYALVNRQIVVQV